MEYKYHSAKDILSDAKALEVTAALVVILVNQTAEEFDSAALSHISQLNDFLVGWLAYRRSQRGDSKDVSET